MNEKKMKRVLTMMYCYLVLGAMDMLALLAYSYIFPGAEINTSVYSKLGLIAIVTFGVLWLCLFFAFLNSQVGKNFAIAYQKYNKRKKHINN